MCLTVLLFKMILMKVFSSRNVFGKKKKIKYFTTNDFKILSNVWFFFENVLYIRSPFILSMRKSFLKIIFFYLMLVSCFYSYWQTNNYVRVAGKVQPSHLRSQISRYIMVVQYMHVDKRSFYMSLTLYLYY